MPASVRFNLWGREYDLPLAFPVVQMSICLRVLETMIAGVLEEKERSLTSGFGLANGASPSDLFESW